MRPFAFHLRHHPHGTTEPVITAPARTFGTEATAREALIGALAAAHEDDSHGDGVHDAILTGPGLPDGGVIIDASGRQTPVKA